MEPDCVSLTQPVPVGGEGQFYVRSIRVFDAFAVQIVVAKEVIPRVLKFY